MGVIITEKKKENRSRNIALTFRATTEERAMIERRMAQSGIKSLRAYLLKQAIDGRVIHVELDSVKEMIRLLSNATNNINQIARRVNETGNIYAADINDLKERYDEIWTQTREIMRRLSAF
jgi:transcriptional regulator of met regulon